MNENEGRLKALLVFLADGTSIVTEAGDGHCWHSEETGSMDYNVGHGATCDICGNPIQDVSSLPDVKGE